MNLNFDSINTLKQHKSLRSYVVSRFTRIFLFVLIPISLFSQTDAPSISGKVKISVKQGTLSCDLVLKYPKKIEGEYVVRLNSGMNIRNFTNNGTGKILDYDIDRTDTLSSGESLAYYFYSDRGKNNLLEKGLRLKYVGMYPVLKTREKDFMVQDWRGNVAFMDGTLRVDGFQSAWYPIIFDKNNQQRYENVNYNIEVECSDCKTLYINGSVPKSGGKAKFISKAPSQMTLFCGNYNFYSSNKVWLLNTGMNKNDRTSFTSIIRNFKTYYEKKINIPYSGDITFIQTTPTAPPDHAFLFVSYPTILNVGVEKYALGNIFNAAQTIDTKSFIAHELAHYYFGHRLKTNTVFGSVINEGFAEFMSLNLTKDVISDSAFKRKIKDQRGALRNFYPNALENIKSLNDFHGREFFVRRYIPLLLLAVKKEIGDEKLWNWLKLMVSSNPVYTDYAFFEQTFLQANGTNSKSLDVINNYFKNPKASDVIINALSSIE